MHQLEKLLRIIFVSKPAAKVIRLGRPPNSLFSSKFIKIKNLCCLKALREQCEAISFACLY